MLQAKETHCKAAFPNFTEPSCLQASEVSSTPGCLCFLLVAGNFRALKDSKQLVHLCGPSGVWSAPRHSLGPVWPAVLWRRKLRCMSTLEPTYGVSLKPIRATEVVPM